MNGKVLRKIYEASGNDGLQLVIDVVELEKQGKVFEFDDWIKFISQGNKSNEQVKNLLVELKETKRLAKELKEGEIIRIGGDERKVIGRDGNEEASFDITVENKVKKEVVRNVEVTTVNAVIDFGDFTEGIKHAIDKRASGVKTGTVESTIEIPSLPFLKSIGGKRQWAYNPKTGDFVIIERDGTIRTKTRNLFQEVAENLPKLEDAYSRPNIKSDAVVRPSATEINPNLNIIDRVNIIDSNGSLIVTIVKENGVWVVKR